MNYTITIDVNEASTEATVMFGTGYQLHYEAESPALILIAIANDSDYLDAVDTALTAQTQ